MKQFPINSIVLSGFPLKALFLLMCSALVLFLSGTAGTAVAQEADQEQETELSLFEPVAENEPRQRPQPRQERNESTASGPEFTLVGTSRIGNKYTATLSRNGETVIVDARPRGNTQIPGHNGFRIVDIRSRQVSVSYPDNTSCVDFVDQGVNCSELGDTAILTLATAAPLEPAESSDRGRRGRRSGDAARQDGEAVAEDEEDAETNPFAALRAAAREQQEARENGERPESARFQPRRIDPDDVPEGMRVVRTPFGDRIIEE